MSDIGRTQERCVLENVPRVHFYEGGPKCPEDFTFPSALAACLEYLGDPLGCEHGPKGRGLGCGYAYLMGVTGAAFFLSWTPSWDMDNVAIHYMSADPGAPFRRGMEAVGYSYELLSKSDLTDEASCRDKIIESIGKGRPVMAFGVVGPPEVSLITGYDEGGDVLIGWSFFQNMPEFNTGLEFEPNGCFRKRDWFKDTEGLLIIGDKQESPPMGDVLRDSLRWALDVVRTPSFWPDRHNGLAAYQAWADQLLQDDQFATDDIAVLMDRYMVHYNVIGVVAEGRWYGSLFLKEMARREPAIADDLLKASECYVGEHDLMWAVWEFAGGNGVSEDHARKLADPGVRRRIAPLILLSRRLDAEAAEHIERTLGR